VADDARTEQGGLIHIHYRAAPPRDFPRAANTERPKLRPHAHEGSSADSA